MKKAFKAIIAQNSLLFPVAFKSFVMILNMRVKMQFINMRLDQLKTCANLCMGYVEK